MKKTKGYVLRKVADEYVLIPHGKKTEEVDKVYTLSDTAAFIYEELEQTESTEELIKKISTVYQVAEKDVEDDVKEVLQYMKKIGIVEFDSEL